MQNFKNLIEKRTSLAVIGLGYVGMPLAIAFADHINVTGFDLNKEKISLYKSGIDPTNEVGNEKIIDGEIHLDGVTAVAICKLSYHCCSNAYKSG